MRYVVIAHRKREISVHGGRGRNCVWIGFDPKEKLGGASTPPDPVPKLTPHASGLFLCWPGFFAALGADQRQEIFGVKRVEASGLLSRGTQGDVNTPIVGQDHHLQIIQHLLPVGRTQVRILRYQLLYLSGSQLVLFAKRPRLKVVRRDTVFHQEVLGAFHASLRKALVVFLRAAGVCMATEDQVGIRLVFQILFEVFGQGFQDSRLTVEQLRCTAPP